MTECFDYLENIYLRYLHTDLLWFLNSRERFKAKPSWFNFRNSSDQIFDADDPWPFITYSIQSAGKLATDKQRRKLT